MYEKRRTNRRNGCKHEINAKKKQCLKPSIHFESLCFRVVLLLLKQNKELSTQTTIKTTKVEGNSQRHTPGSWTVHGGFNLMSLKVTAVFAFVYMYVNTFKYKYSYHHAAAAPRFGTLPRAETLDASTRRQKCLHTSADI